MVSAALYILEKMVPITGRASSVFEYFLYVRMLGLKNKIEGERGERDSTTTRRSVEHWTRALTALG